MHVKQLVLTLTVIPLSIGCSMAWSAAHASVTIAHCWIRALPGNLPAGGYFTATNNGDAPVFIVSVQTDAYGMAMLHETQRSGDTSRMTMLDHVAVPAKGTLTFSPGGYHVMFEHPEKPIEVGMTIPVVFTLSDSYIVSTQCAVKSASTVSN